MRSNGLTCNDCKLPNGDPLEPRCAACVARCEGRRLINRDYFGHTLCLCGCRKPAEIVYLTRVCYLKHHQRRLRGRYPSLLNACPLWYDETVRITPEKPAETLTAYHGAELADVVPDELFARELAAAIGGCAAFPMIGEGMTT
jgi:hypothetical protein